jgi:outer membrane protein
MNAAGTAIPGTSVSVSNRATPTFDAGYYFTKNIATSLTAGVPPKSTMSGQQAVAPYGNLGAVRYGPAVLSAHYHFLGLGALQPYVGAGATYLIVFKKHDAAVQDLMVHNSFSPIARAGADYMFSKRWGVYADWWQTWLVVDAHGALEGTVPVKAHVRLYPTVVTTGLVYRF